MGSNSRVDRLRREEESRLRAGGERATALEQRTDEARSSFDSAAAAREVASVQFADFREQLGEDVESIRGNQVSRGRLDTGFGMEDEDRYITGALKDLDQELVRNAFTAQSLDLQNTAGTQRAAETAREQDLSLLAGSTDRAQAEENQRQQKKRRRFGLLGGLVGAGAGFLIPGIGPVGGAKLGGAIAGGLS